MRRYSKFYDLGSVMQIQQLPVSLFIDTNSYKSIFSILCNSVICTQDETCNNVTEAGRLIEHCLM